jgi:hypothetical protein
MRRLFLAIIVLAAVAAYFSNPSQTRINAQIDAMLQTAINDERLDDLSDPAAAIALLACKTDVQICAQMLRHGFELNFSDQKLFTTVRATGFGKAVTCFAAYTRLFCPGGLNDA